jgi:hypothetical protein
MRSGFPHAVVPRVAGAGVLLTAALLLHALPAAAGQWRATSASGERFSIVAEERQVKPRLFVERHTADGSPYPGFGVRGRVELPLLPNDEPPAGLAVDEAGRILVVGANASPNGTTQAFVIRLQASGLPDTSWGQGGRSVDAPSSGNVRALDVLPLGEGRVLVAGTVEVAGDERAAAWHLGADGRLDMRPTRASRFFLASSDASRAVSLTAVSPAQVVIAVRVMGDTDMWLEGHSLDVRDANAVPRLLSRQPWPPAWGESPQWKADAGAQRWVDPSIPHASFAAVPAAAQAKVPNWTSLAAVAIASAPDAKDAGGAAMMPFGAREPAVDAGSAASGTEISISLWAAMVALGMALVGAVGWLLRRVARRTGAASD